MNTSFPTLSEYIKLCIICNIICNKNEYKIMSLNFNLSFAMRHGIVILSRIKAIKHARGSQLWPSRSSLVPLPFFLFFECFFASNQNF